MSNTGSNFTQTKPDLKKIELVGSPLLVISDEILKKIKYLCANIPKVEWSGILMYTVEGSISNAEEMKIYIQDILLMDRGTSAYTEFDWDEDFVNYKMDNPESMDWLVGHVHSHNTMTVFFSGTDWSELNDNCPNHNFYLSLIVNNFMDMVAKIAFTGDYAYQPPIELKYGCKNEKGENYTLTMDNPFAKSVSETIMFVYDCKLQHNDETLIVPEIFSKRLEEILAKPVKVTTITTGYQANKHHQNANFENEWGEYGHTKDENYPKDKNKYNNDNYHVGKSTGKLFPDYNGKTHEKQIDESLIRDRDKNNNFQDRIVTVEEQFGAYVLRLGHRVMDDDIINALEDLNIGNLNYNSLEDVIDIALDSWYMEFFDLTESFTVSKYIETLEKVIDCLGVHEKQFNEITDVFIPAIRLAINEIETMNEEEEDSIRVTTPKFQTKKEKENVSTKTTT